MIDIKTLTDKDVGRWVVYKRQIGDREFDREEGRIKSWNKFFIFVVYKCDGNWHRFKDYTGCATSDYDLTFLEDKI